MNKQKNVRNKPTWPKITREHYNTTCWKLKRRQKIGNWFIM